MSRRKEKKEIHTQTFLPIVKMIFFTPLFYCTLCPDQSSNSVEFTVILYD